MLGLFKLAAKGVVWGNSDMIKKYFYSNYKVQSMIQKLADEIASIPLFQNLDDKAAMAIAKVVQEKQIKRDETILRQSESGYSMFIILDGRVKVVLFGEDGKEVILSTLKTGDFFGEMSLLDGQTRSATIIATEDTRLLELQREGFLEALKLQPELGLAILGEMSRRLRIADQNIKSLALLDVYGRVARALRLLSRDEGTQAGMNIVIESRPTHQELAARAGTSRETVSRVIGDLIRAGFITMDGRRLIIHNEFLDEQEFDDLI